MDYFYWDTQLSLDILKKALRINPGSFTKRIFTREVEVRCTKCKGTFSQKVSTRSKRDEAIAKGDICYDCLQAKWDKREQAEINRKNGQAKRRVKLWGFGKDLENMPYGEFLKTYYWKNFSHKAREQAFYMCQDCNKTNTALHVHHLTYERRGREWYEDVVVLCGDCHMARHGVASAAK